MNKFKKVLVANRGEIAVRIIRCLREMGIGSVAVYSNADKNSFHTQLADESVYIGESDSLKSYLNIPGIIEVAKLTKCQAIHPGYGFLAENPKFVDACQAANIVFIGPDSKSMSLMGDKINARNYAANAGVTVIPGMNEPVDDVEVFIKKCASIDFPILIKATAGGGGKGMRFVREKSELALQAELAIKESKAAFGDGRIYAEKYLNKPRHIEFQILADMHGNFVHLNERECSIQRRYQKLIEESPSPAISQKQREKMGQDALKVTRACSYTGAGTIEFMYIDDDHYYFLEMNTRIQVEHPVTEMVTGIDILRSQIEIAQGESLTFSQDDIHISGHAIEARIYAEDSSNNFSASPGNIIYLEWAKEPGIRIDEGIRCGSEVTVFYDPLLAKIIVHGQTREYALNRMKEALKQTKILGVKTVIPFLSKLIDSSAFKKGQTDITLLDNIKDEINNIKPEFFNIALGTVAYMEESASPNYSKKSQKADKFINDPWMLMGTWEIGT